MLFLDCGNTALKCLYLNSVTTFTLNDDHFKSALMSYINKIAPNTSIVYSSVSSSKVLQSITAILNGHFSHRAQMAISENRFEELKIGYIDTKQLGVDRWLAMIATKHIKLAKIIIDAGSWIKMDMVLDNGQHLGGAIISKSQHHEHDIFNRFSIDINECASKAQTFGTSTQHCLCIAKGHYHLNAVTLLLTQWLSYLASGCHIIVTGGEASLIIQTINQLDLNSRKHILDIQHSENLVLSGLSLRYPH